MIENFWNWMYSSVQNAISILTTMVNNNELSPFFDLLLVVLGIGVIIKFILSPLLGITLSSSSDKLNKKHARDAEYKQLKED